MINYKLLTPGPLTTSATVKAEMMVDHCTWDNGLKYRIQHFHYSEVPDAKVVEAILKEDPEITHVSMVHSETTSGILNDIESVGKVAKAFGKVYIVDAMSSFAGVEIPVAEWGIDFIISSANKCIQGVPGFSFIIYV